MVPDHTRGGRCWSDRDRRGKDGLADLAAESGLRKGEAGDAGLALLSSTGRQLSRERRYTGKRLAAATPAHQQPKQKHPQQHDHDHESGLVCSSRNVCCVSSCETVLGQGYDERVALPTRRGTVPPIEGREVLTAETHARTPLATLQGDG